MTSLSISDICEDLYDSGSYKRTYYSNEFGLFAVDRDSGNVYLIDFTVTGAGGTIPAPTPPSTPSGLYRATECPHTYTLNLSPLDRELLQRIIDQKVTFDHQGERP